ncbi:MAG TPA: LLM class flavin-dependent oxidoreductase [Thermoanaerobaculia bacterium]|nr:LLM class flavin-dependent oxidoreductase [Thermoanaerobaculia bacterium]
MRLSVLDQSPISDGSTGADALRNSVDLAAFTESVGYERYWVAEHHGTPALACANPVPLIGAIGAATSRIRVGSGGVMLPHYSPLHVAETFSMLSALCPQRIDLAVGRAAGTDPVTAFALQRDRRQAAPDDFPAQLVELMAYLENDMPADHPFARLMELPGRPELPDLWLLGSSPQSGIWAAELGLPYAFADFINPNGAEIAARYRSTFTPTALRPSPKMMVAVWALCAETDEEARRIASSAKMMFTLFFRGQLIPIPPIETALQFLERERQALSPSESVTIPGRRTIVGTPDVVRAGIETVAAEYGADEVMVVTITYDHEDRKRSYELIAKAFSELR